jgi:hypothetical protein
MMEREQTVRAHDTGNIGSNRAHKRMHIDLVHGLIIDVRGRRRTVMFLFIADVVLRGGLDTLALDSDDGFVGGFTSQVWITA